jgi:hypothetical protein
VVKVGLSEYQVGRLAVLESFRVVPRQHTIIELFVAAKIRNVNVIRRGIRIDRHALRKAESLAVDQVVETHVENCLPQHCACRITMRAQRRIELEHSIVVEVGGEHVAERVDADAGRIAQTCRRGRETPVAREALLPDDRSSRRVHR